MAKSPDAFRTISEVADWLGIQAHVLRFWESKFTQVKPIKRAGGRRYYRPADMLLLGGIKQLLHDDGLTIKGVQKILREEGMNHVAGLSQPLDEDLDVQIAEAPEAPAPSAEPAEEKGVVLSFGGRGADEEVPVAEATAEDEPAPKVDEQPDVSGEPEAQQAETTPVVEAESVHAEPEADAEGDAQPSAEPVEAASAPAPVEEEPAQEQPAAAAPAEDEPEATKAEEPTEAPEPVSALPAFLRRPLAEPDPETEPKAAPQDAASEPAAAEPQDTPPEPATAPEPAPVRKPRILDVPPFTPEADFPASPASLSAAYRARRISKEQAALAAPLLEQLTTLRDAMAARRRNPPTPSAKD